MHGHTTTIAEQRVKQTRIQHAFTFVEQSEKQKQKKQQRFFIGQIQIGAEN